jgi:hypothetical protein
LCESRKRLSRAARRCEIVFMVFEEMRYLETWDVWRHWTIENTFWDI